MEKTRMIKNDITLIWMVKESEQHCIMLLGMKMTHYKELFPYLSHNGFIILSGY